MKSRKVKSLALLLAAAMLITRLPVQGVYAAAIEEESVEDSAETDLSEETKDSEAQEESEATEAETETESAEATVEEPAAASEEDEDEVQISGGITLDADLKDWSHVTARASNDSEASYWKVAFSADRQTLYVCYTGTAVNEWSYYYTDKIFALTYANGTQGSNSSFKFVVWNGGGQVKNGWYQDISGAAVSNINESNGNNAGRYVVEGSVPVSFFSDTDFTISFGGTAVSSADIETADGYVAEEETEEEPAVYSGITIDGNFSDWDAVTKTEASCPNSDHPSCISEAAAVFDGDWFYIYIRDGAGSNASGAGEFSNGKYSVSSDLGYETVIQLSTEPSVSGVDGAVVSYYGSEWEIAIPKSQLPKYESSLNFGFYNGAKIISGIENLQDEENNLESTFSGIVYDGQYEDWEDYPHTNINYNGAGSGTNKLGGQSALYSDGDKLYGHVVSEDSSYTQSKGGEFTSAISIVFNQTESDLTNGSYDWTKGFYPQLISVDESGNINWNPTLSGLSEGSYEFYIASGDAWRQSTNINNLVTEMDKVYGKMTITIKDGKDEMEYYLDLSLIASKLGLETDEIDTIAAQYGKIGQQWTFTAGTSTAPVVGLSFCFGTVILAWWYKRRRKLV